MSWQGKRDPGSTVQNEKGEHPYIGRLAFSRLPALHLQVLGGLFVNLETDETQSRQPAINHHRWPKRRWRWSQRQTR